MIAQIGVGGGTGHVLEYSGPAVRALSMEERMTVCNMSIEGGARAGLIAPDDNTFEYLADRPHAPQGADWNAALVRWRQLPSDEEASYHRSVTLDASALEPMITYGTNPGMGAKIVDQIPLVEEIDPATRDSYEKSLAYMDFKAGSPIAGRKVDYIFVGSCTNGRIEDLREVAQFVKGRKKAEYVTAWIVPGSKQVEEQAHKEGITRTLEAAGFKLRQPGCSACLAMNDDKVPEGLLAVATSNRNFEGRQGPGARTMLASPLTAAAAAITGKVTDPRELL